MSAERFDVIAVMTADEARYAINAINGHMNSARALLLDLYERRGWVALGYASWRACAVAEFGEQEREVYRALQAAQVEQNVQSVLTNLSKPLPESQLRPLAALPAPVQPIALERAQATALERGERMSAQHITHAVREIAAWAPERYEEDMPDQPSRFNEGMRSSATDKWNTPERIVERALALFGTIDLDPCSNSDDPGVANVPARTYYTEASDGLAQPWFGTVYMNPPYGRAIGDWVERLITSYAGGAITAAIALLPARTDTDWFAPLFAYPICFIHGRLSFNDQPGAAPFPSVAVYLGSDVQRFVRIFHDLGPIMAPYSSGDEGYNTSDIRTPNHASRVNVTA